MSTPPPDGSGPAPTLTDEHRRAVQGWFRRLGLNLHDAEDCAQTTLLRVQGALGRYEERAPFSAFLRRVSRSVYADWCRRQRVRRAELAQAAVLEEQELLAPSADPAGSLDLAAAVARLPPKLADVLELSVRQGLGYREVALRLGIPVGTVKSRMFLAVRRLRKELDRDA